MKSSAEATATGAENSLQELQTRISQLEKQVARTADRGAVENLFSNYMYYHNAFQDDPYVVDMWVKKGTPGIRAQYSNLGVYTTWESVIEYHRDRPTPEGKLILHYTTTPSIQIAEDGQTARGLWIMAGTESGLTDPEVAKTQPDFIFENEMVQGKKVWAHWIWCKYEVDFLKQDGEWKIWHFRCFEVARAPFSENWISFADKNSGAFDLDLRYFGEDGKPVFMPKPDAAATSLHSPYSPKEKQKLMPVPPRPYKTFQDIE